MTSLLDAAKTIADQTETVPKYWQSDAWHKAKAMFYERESAGKIALKLNLSKSKVLRAIREYNWPQKEQVKIEPKVDAEVTQLPNRDFALPPGHPLTWGVICSEPFPGLYTGR
jgi:hypothetical protein